MGDSRRAAWSAALLAGFWLVAWLQVVVAIAVVLVILSLLPSDLALRVGAPLCIATAGLLGFATARALRIRHATPAGVPVTRQDAPDLWALAEVAATAAAVAPPDTIVVIADARVALSERYRLVGLRGGRRELHLGLPMLQAWDVARLQAAVGHELAHGSAELGRFAPMAYRGRRALARVVPRIPRRSPAGPLLRVVAGVFRRVDAPLARAQELVADRVAATIAGSGAASDVLRDGPALDGMQRLFHAEYLSAGWQAGYVPDDIFGGFLRVLAARADDMAALRALDPAPPGPWDPHPPLGERLVALTSAASARDVASPTASPGGEQAGAPASTEDSSGSVGGANSLGGVGSAGDVGPVGGAGSDAGGTVADGSAAGSSAADVEHSAASTGPAGASSSGGGSAGPAPTGVVANGARPASADDAGNSAVAGAATSLATASSAAADLVPDLPALGRALQAVAFPPAGRTVVAWDDFFTAARNTEMEREADAALRTIGRAAGTPVTSPADVLDLVADGRLHKVAEIVFEGLSSAETADRVTDLVTLLLALAALRSGVGRWRHSWSGAAELVAVDGSHLDLAEPAALAGDAATVDLARTVLARLGINLAADTADRRPARVPVLGGVVNVLADGARTDVLVIETGFLLLPSLPRSRNGDAKRRLFRLASGGLHADGTFAGETDASGRFVPFAEVTAAVTLQGRRRQWDLTLADGTTTTIRTTLDSDELQGGWSALDEAAAFIARTRAVPPVDPPPTSAPSPESAASPSEPAAVSDAAGSAEPEAVEREMAVPASAPTSGSL